MFEIPISFLILTRLIIVKPVIGVSERVIGLMDVLHGLRVPRLSGQTTNVFDIPPLLTTCVPSVQGLLYKQQYPSDCKKRTNEARQYRCG